MSYSIDEIEGIGPAYAEKLKAVGIKTTEAYLERAKDPKAARSWPRRRASTTSAFSSGPTWRT